MFKQRKGFLYLAVILVLVSFSLNILLLKNRKQEVITSYKEGLFSGKIPVSWSEYGDGFGHMFLPVSDPHVIGGYGYDTYAKYVADSISPGTIMFSDIPFERLDTFIITPKLRDILINEGKKRNEYSAKVFGKNNFQVVTFDEKGEGGRRAEYFLELPPASDGTPEVALFIEYDGTREEFLNGVTHYLSTLDL